MSVPLTRNSGTGSVEFLEIFFSVLNAPCQSRAKRARSSSAACVERQRTGGTGVERLTEAASTFIRDAHMLPAPGVSPHNRASAARPLTLLTAPAMAAAPPPVAPRSPSVYTLEALNNPQPLTPIVLHWSPSLCCLIPYRPQHRPPYLHSSARASLRADVTRI